MVDPMTALTSFQTALTRGQLLLEPGRLHPEISTHFDVRPDVFRVTYARIEGRDALAIAMIARKGQKDGLPCFQVGYAVKEKSRGKGLATEVLTKGIAEFRNGFGPLGGANYFLEAVVAVDNEPSKRVASKVISQAPTPCTDAYSGEEALYYVRRVSDT
jgi:hypothetical protein